MQSKHYKKLVLVILIAGASYAVAIFLIARPTPLSPAESQLLGTWTSSQTGDDPGLHYEFHRDRTVVRRVSRIGEFQGKFCWRVEDGVLIVEDPPPLLDRLFTRPAPDITRVRILSVTPEKLELGTGSGASAVAFVRGTK